MGADAGGGKEKQQQGARRSSSSSSRGQGEAAAGGKEKQQQQHASPMHGVGVAQVLDFEREGHTMLRGLIQGDALERLAEAVQSEYNHRATEAYTQKLREIGVSRGGKAALAKVCQEKGLPVPTLQVYNLHRADRPASKVVRELATSAEMGRVAADLLGVDSVMLYQTAAFFKFAGEGETAWHSDLNTAPFDTNYMVTFWIALTDVPTLQHSPLEFASRSHKDFALPYWYTIKGMKELDSRGYVHTNIY
jgi:ectoine hydroxylase-related dioxygenase (phytanoyl-CoA dioxygenase family)